MDWSRVFAGGVKEVAVDYEGHQKSQRAYNLQQKVSDADMLRKQNFARFGKNLDMAKYKEKQAIEMTSFKEKEDYRGGAMDSMYVDEQGQPLTKAEIANRPEGIKGLKKKSDYINEEKIANTGKATQAKIKAKLDRAKDDYGVNSTEYKKALAASHGLTTSERRQAKDKADKVLYNVGKEASKMSKGPDAEMSHGLASLIAFENSRENTDRETDEVLVGTKQAKKLNYIQGIASSIPTDTPVAEILEMYEEGEFDLQLKSGKTKRPPKDAFNLALEYFGNKNGETEGGWKYDLKKWLSK
jgi:hypothetical protein